MVTSGWTVIGPEQRWPMRQKYITIRHESETKRPIGADRPDPCFGATLVLPLIACRSIAVSRAAAGSDTQSTYLHLEPMPLRARWRADLCPVFDMRLSLASLGLSLGPSIKQSSVQELNPERSLWSASANYHRSDRFVTAAVFITATSKRVLRQLEDVGAMWKLGVDCDNRRLCSKTDLHRATLA